MVASACLIIGKVEEGKKDLATMVGYYLLVASSQEEKIHQQAGLHCYFSLEVSLFFFLSQRYFKNTSESYFY